MNIKTLVFALIVVSVTSGCASKTVQVTQTDQVAETVQGTELVQTTDNDSYDPDEVTCRMIAKTGSRVKSKVCGTNRQWKQIAEESANDTEKIQHRLQGLKGEGG